MKPSLPISDPQGLVPLAQPETLGDSRTLQLCRAYNNLSRPGRPNTAPMADAFIAVIEAGSPHYLEAQIRGTRAMIRLARADPPGAIRDAELALPAGRAAQDPQMLVHGARRLHVRPFGRREVRRGKRARG